MPDVGEVKYRVTADDSGLDQQISHSEGKLKAGFGRAAVAVGAAATAAVGAAATAVASITKQAVSAYADYEQLTGGVETLFKDAADKVIEYADHAYITAGLSANEYMETVTGFSASLIQSLGGDTEEAARLANQAILDMSDNANKMGSDMESIQNAYQGFAKQNYTMLDNLKLGYGGTKEEMQRLLTDAEKIAGVKFDISSYADVVKAIHVMQESMGIAGTTALEAKETISGSMRMMQASWQNVLTAFGTGSEEQITNALDNLTFSVETFAGNLLPVIEHALQGISQMVSEMAPVIARKLPKMIEDALPPLLTAAGEVIETLAKGLIEALPKMMPTVTQLIVDLAKMIISMAPEIIKTGIQLIVELAKGIVEALPDLIPAVIDAILTIVDTLTDPDNLMMLLDAAIEIIIALAEGLIEALPRLIEKAPEIIYNLVVAIIKAAPKLLQAALELILTLVRGIVQAFGKIIEVGGQIVDKVKSGFSQKVQDAKNWGRDVIQNFINGIKEKFNALKDSVKNVAQTVKSYLGFSEPEEGPLSDFHTYAPDMMDLYAKGIKDNIGKVEDSVEDVSATVAESFNADVSYNLPDIAGYAADLSASLTAQASTSIEIPLYLDGREIARGTAWYMSEQLAWEAR